MGINPARRATIRVLGSECFSHFGVLALERNNWTQFTPASKAGLLVEGTVRKNWTACLEPRTLRPKQPKGDWYSRAWDTWAGENTSRIWPFDQLKFPRTLRDYSSGSPEFEGLLATAFVQCGWGSRRSSVI